MYEIKIVLNSSRLVCLFVRLGHQIDPGLDLVLANEVLSLLISFN